MKSILALTAPLLAMFASVFTLSPATSETNVTPKKWDVSSIEGHMLETQLTWCKQNFKGDYKTECTYKFWKQFAPLFGPLASFRAVVKERATRPDFIPECHHAMHAIGQAAFREYGSFAALRLSDSSCQGGYVHGIIQEWTLAFTGEEQVATVCEPTKGINGDNRTYSMCGHGLGHAVALRFPTSYTEALRVCEKDASPELRSACATGVVMEFAGGDHVTLGLQAELASAPKNNLKPSDVASGCNVLKDAESRNGCWGWHHMLVPDAEKKNPSTYAKNCEAASSVPADYAICVSRWAEYATYHLGISSVRDPEIGSKITVGFEGCASLTEDASIVEACQIRLVDNIWRDEPLTSKVPSFCQSVSSKFRDVCLKGEAGSMETRKAA